ncbi:MAG: TraM recognition domain-containing protein, partial [Proteobacteria bacterium]|nr:TraM recognition domain-containing protein [Pseudomonadota bacterium]
MTLDAKFEYKHVDILRDARPWRARFADFARDPSSASMIFAMAAVAIYTDPTVGLVGDLVFVMMLIYFLWLVKIKVSLPFKLPKSARRKDPNYKRPDGSIGMSDGILYLGNNAKTGEEIWFNNNDARTHCLYLGTTGSGKTFGLKSYACNALCWSSGYIYIDGKADTDLWSTLSAQARRFGRDDDLLIMNYMTGGLGGKVPSNTLNPFSSGSASYLTNMLVSLMPESEGDNAMWKDRAVALVSAIMPCLVWKRDNQNLPLNIGVVRNYLVFKAVIKLSREPAVPERLRAGLRGYLNELPGYVDNVFDDEGNEKPQSPDAGAVDTSTPRQQHGYLSMQFTRSMSSLGDDYGFIFDTPAADVDMLDVVLNRRILIVLIPALEKSGDETANLGKIIASTLKGMMGQTLGSTVEGDSAKVIENKPTTSATPFIAIFDEVGYYAAQGMAVMAAQARSLGFSLVFAAQDMPSLEKRVKEEARSITANCNIKLFGKLEDPTQTKEFFEKTVGQAMVTEVSGFERNKDGGKGYSGSQNASVQVRARASYDALKGFNEGRSICSFGKIIQEMQIYNSDIGHAKAMRVHRFLPIPPPSEEALASLHQIDDVLKRFRNPKWDPEQVPLAANPDIAALASGFSDAKKFGSPLIECGALAVAAVAEKHGTIKPGDATEEATTEASTPSSPAAPTAAGTGTR